MHYLVSNLASNLVDYSITQQFPDRSLKDKLVTVIGESVSEPLQLEIAKVVRKRGGHADLVLIPRDRTAFLYASEDVLAHGSDKQLAYVPSYYRKRIEDSDAVIHVGGQMQRGFYDDYRDRLTIARDSMHGLEQLAQSKPFIFTIYPTIGDAVRESVSFTTYEHELIEAAVVDYRKMMRDQEALVNLVTSENQIHVRTFDTERKAWCDLKFDTGNNIARSSHGLHTLCDGMVYTSPYPESVEGDVFFNEYVNTGSGDIKRAYLQFRNGRVVQSKAWMGDDNLKNILKQEAGSNEVGAFIFGTNPRLRTFFRHLPLPSRVGGSISLVLGGSYDSVYLPLVDLTGDNLAKERSRLCKKRMYNESSIHLPLQHDIKRDNGATVRIGRHEVSWKGDKWVVS